MRSPPRSDCISCCNGVSKLCHAPVTGWPGASTVPQVRPYKQPSPSTPPPQFRSPLPGASTVPQVRPYKQPSPSTPSPSVSKPSPAKPSAPSPSVSQPPPAAPSASTPPPLVYWKQLPGLAQAIGVGAKGHVWVIGTNARPSGYDIYRWSGNGWTSVPGGGVRVAVDPR
jgi:hypothetical protein